MTNPMSVIHDLPALQWGSLYAPPYDVVGFDWDNGLASREYPYVDGEGHDACGAAAIPMPATLYFLNSLEPGAFPDLWNKWQPMLFDGEARTLVHPLLGPQWARVQGGSVKLQATTTAGIIVDVKWIQTLKDPNKALTYDIVDVSLPVLAEAADAACLAADIDFPSEEGVTDLFDLVTQIESAIYSANLSLTGGYNVAKGKIEQMMAIADGQAVHTNWPAKTLLVQLWQGIDDAQKKALKEARPTASATTSHDTTVDKLASERGNTVAEMMQLNPDLIAAPVVSAGTNYSYYTA